MRYLVDHPSVFLESVSLKQRDWREAPKSKENDKETLERRLRLLDLKIEREEILNQLAALQRLFFMGGTMLEPMEFTEAVFQQVVGQYRIRVEYRNYWSPYMTCWAQAFNSYFCEASDVYMDECYEYPWRPFIHSTGYSDDGKPIPITREAAAKDIRNAYKELTLTPEERQARRERSEKIKQQIRKELKKEGTK